MWSVTGDTDDDYIVLTDIQGLEDFFGDMDFKVTGTTEGITAIQMDIKIHGLTRPIVEEAIARTREARLFIMDTCMKPAIAEPRKTVGEYAPRLSRQRLIRLRSVKLSDSVVRLSMQLLMNVVLRLILQMTDLYLYVA